MQVCEAGRRDEAASSASVATTRSDVSDVVFAADDEAGLAAEGDEYNEEFPAGAVYARAAATVSRSHSGR